MNLTQAGWLGVHVAVAVCNRSYGSDRVSPPIWVKRMSLLIGYIRYQRGLA